MRARIVTNAGALGLAVFLATACWTPYAEAQEPLMLRIRPQGDRSQIGMSGMGALAAREAFEARITERANKAIASVCQGCLRPATEIAEFHARGAR